MNVLVTGGGGQLARAVEALCPIGDAVVVRTIDELDITDPAAVHAQVASMSPDLIVNAAAYTAVDRAEEEEAAARAVNAEGPRHLAEAAALSGATLVHVSTDYVFDGTSSKPYRPEDQPNPLSAYGRTKLEGERAVVEVLGSEALIVRTAWLYDAVGPNFLTTMLRLMNERTEVRVVDDQCGTPTWAPTLARAIWGLVDGDARGIFHVTDAGRATWHDFACEIKNAAYARSMIPDVTVIPIPGSEYPTPAPRPASSVLDVRAVEPFLSSPLPPWQQNVVACIESMCSGPA